MKRVILRNWMAAALLLGAGCGLVACDEDNDDPTEPDVTAVQGNYSGKMTIVEVNPTDGEETPSGTDITATVAADKILFEDFPVRDLIVKIAGEDMADQIVEKLGQVDYAVPYTALMSEDKATIKLTLSPETLKLTLPGDSGNDGEEGGATTTSEGAEEGENDTEIEVTITSDAEGTYTLESKSLVFGLAATAVKLNGQEMPFEGLSLSFELTKK